ncbi:MAG: VCBS repeat-containing protein, partial [Chitinophagaceae bacterium]|nr:VCBS repeat-containing protein [Chitinophagaceae bacterium]
MYKTKLRAGKWAFLIITTFLLATKAVAQDGLPVIVLSNGAASTVNSWVVDPDSLRGNYPFGNTTMVLTGPPGSYFGIFLDSFKKRSDFDTVRIHDGNSVSAPVLTYFTSYTFGGPQPPRTVKSSSNVITIYFHAHNDLPVAGVGWRLGVRSITDPAGEMPSFLPVFQTDLTTGAIDLADYDNDNDKDVLINGQIFQNMAGDDSMYIFNRMLQPIGSWTSSNMKSADFNADGLKDVFIVGESNLSGTYAATAALFRNNGDNTFTRINIPGMPNAGRGSCAITDINGDGRPD